MAAVPSIGRANRVEGGAAPEADLTRALYEQYASQIFRFCLHQLGSREEAEDAVQSTFLNAFRGIRRGIVPQSESAWLFKIAHNVCLSRRRSSWRRDRVESPADFELVEELTPAPSSRRDELIGLQDVLEGMPEQQRRAILLREWQGLSYREIGEELELTQSAVETLIFRARRALADGLEQPAERPRRKRLASSALANLVSLGSGAAAKIAALVAVAGVGTVVATAPVHRPAPQQPQRRVHLPAPAPARVPAHEPAATRPAAAHVVVPARPAAKPAPRPKPVTRHVAPQAARPVPAVVTQTPAPAPQPQAAAPGRVKAAGTPAVGRGKATAPGRLRKQQKKQQPQPPAAEVPAAPAQHGKATAPGQLKKSDPPPAEEAGPPTGNGSGHGKP
ncbi:MAG TPA: RNA polymerase sigma factor [Gaiellaceae bacterium]